MGYINHKLNGTGTKPPTFNLVSERLPGFISVLLIKSFYKGVGLRSSPLALCDAGRYAMTHGPTKPA